MIRRRRFLQTGTAVLTAAPALPALAAPHQLTPRQAAAHALNRVGFGPRPGDLDNVSRDPRGWIDQQLRPGTEPLPPSLAARLDESRFTQGDVIEAVRELVTRIRENQAQQAQGTAVDETRPENPVRLLARSYQLPAIESRLFRALESPRQLEEAMVDFWFNHFNVFQGKSWLRVMVGHYEHNAIRPHALGRFRDLLGAVAHHPAMLYYLDNWQSVGPQAQSRGRGLNENYARELMELHTLGVDGGYTQQDVTQLARMLTGWTMPARAYAVGGVPAGSTAAGIPAASGAFVFNARLHDNGEKTWMGHRVESAGQAEGEFALDVLARHPSTARHIAFKLVQHFVSDQPDPALVDKLASVFLAQDGQIVPVLRALFASDAFWSQANVGTKFKTPYHYCVSTLRAGGWGVRTGGPLAVHLATQGMPLYGCPTPDGYKTTESAWLSADGMNKRLEYASQVASGRLGPERLAGGMPPAELADQLGPLVTPATRSLALESEAQPAVALAMLLAGPGMMRR